MQMVHGQSGGNAAQTALRSALESLIARGAMHGLLEATGRMFGHEPRLGGRSPWAFGHRAVPEGVAAVSTAYLAYSAPW